MDGSGPLLKTKFQARVEPGKPITFQFMDSDETDADVGPYLDSEGGRRLGETFKAYRESSKALLDGRYAAVRQLVPPHIRELSSAFILRCCDGILVRYDPPGDDRPRVRVGVCPQPLAEIAPQISENVLHFPADPTEYVPPAGVSISLRVVDGQSGTEREAFSLSLAIFGSTILRDGMTLPAPPARPLPLIAISNEFELSLQGIIDSPAKHLVPQDLREEVSFVTSSRIMLPVGWRAIEVYPLLSEEYWRPEVAPLWAELDILAAVAQRNLLDEGYRKLDCRGEARKHWSGLLAEFEALLQGPEEPVHQFIKVNPTLLNTSFNKCWSKMPFGNYVSDFVFCEPPGDYELVEIEAPIRKLFREDGQQRQELTHAINQIDDWIEYIADNKKKVEEELGLVGISATPRALVVIGRSASLTDENRRKLVTLQERQTRLCILTYDDVLARARANLDRLFGPLGITGHNVEFYFFREPRPQGPAATKEAPGPSSR